MTAYYGGKKIKGVYLGTPNTNCLTHIPNDIKLELSNGTLTLKKGSKVYVPNGWTNYKYYKYTYENWTRPTLTANGTMGGSSFAVAQSSVVGGLDFYKAVSGISHWHANAGFPQWVSWYNPNLLKVTKLSFGGMSEGNITKGIIQASNDNSNWIDLVEFDNTILTKAWEIDLSSNTKAYKYYRIYITNASYYSGAFYALIDKGFKITAQVQTGSVESTADDYDYKVGSGSMIFDEVVISSDLTVSIASNNKWFIYYNVSDNNLWFADMAGTRSGTTNPSDLWGFFYNSTDNKVYYLRNGTTPDNLTFSLPVAVVISDGTQITSIDQVFNGFGYIGSLAFVLPNVKTLVANGFNADGTYKSKEWTVNKVLLTDGKLYNDANSLIIRNHLKDLRNAKYHGSLSANPQINASHGCYYNYVENIFYGASATSQNNEEIFLFGSMTNDGSKITSLTPNKVQPEMTGREISRIYKGSTLVYGYKPNQVLLEKSTAGTYALNIKYGGYYEVTIVGGGGGGAYNVSTKYSDGVISGGSGAGFKGIIHLKAGTYIVKVGAGGTSVNPGNASTAMPGVGSSSSIGNIITAGCANADGTANAGYNGSGNVISKGGVLTYDQSAVRSYTIASNGNDGLQGWNTSVAGASSVISGTNYGAGDKGQNGAMSKGYDGYVKIVAI